MDTGDPHNLQALASAATYQNSQIPLPTTTYADSASRGNVVQPASSSTDNAIDPNLDRGEPPGHTMLEGVTEHAAAHTEQEAEMAALAQALRSVEDKE